MTKNYIENGPSNLEDLKKIVAAENIVEVEEEALVQEAEEEVPQKIEIEEEEDILDQDLLVVIHQTEKLQEEEIEAEVIVEEELEEAAEAIVERIVEKGMKKRLMDLTEEEEDLSHQKRKNHLKMTRVQEKTAQVRIKNQKTVKERTQVYLLKNKLAKRRVIRFWIFKLS